MSAPRSTRPVKPKVSAPATVKPKVSAPAAIKPKAVAPAAIKPKVSAPAAAVVKAVAPAAASPKAVAADVKASDSPAHKSRVQTNKVIGVNISAARVRRHIDKLNLNRLLDELIAEQKDELSKCEEAKAVATTAGKVDTVGEELLEKVKHKIAALSRSRTRFSSEASVVLSIVCDELIQQIVRHTIQCMLDSKKKILQVCHLHSDGVDKIPLFPLVKTLPSFAKNADMFAAEVAEEENTNMVSALLAQAEKDFKKKYSVRSKKSVADSPSEEEGDESPKDDQSHESEEEGAESKTSFRCYVHQVYTAIKNDNPDYARVRISRSFKHYLSDLLVEFIQRIAPLVLLTTNSMKNKTINDVAILRTIENILVDGHTPVETIVLADSKGDNCDNPFVAVRNTTYPTSCCGDLFVKIDAKIKLYNAIGDDKSDSD